MFDSIEIGGAAVEPALFLAPMAGITNSAFRRLVSDFGGYGALFTEMLSGKAFLHERLDQSAFTKRRTEEGRVIYQFRVSGNEDVEAIFARAQCYLPLAPTAMDLNLGCPAPEIQWQASGAALFRDFGRLRSVLERIRKVYGGALTAKCRLGDDESWRGPFLERLRLFEDSGICALTVHPRLSTERLKRRARWEEFPWIANSTKIPIIGNGDVVSPKDVEGHRAYFEPLAGLMLGRAVAARPWIFREFAGLGPMAVDYAEVWEHLYQYTMEDLPPERAFGRLKEFTRHYAGNFTFGHSLEKAVQGAKSLEDVRTAALGFLANGPEIRRGALVPCRGGWPATAGAGTPPPPPSPS
jgi:tRNA-dihydrouridine synthase